MRFVFVLDGEELDPYDLTVRDLNAVGIDPLVGMEPTQLIGVMLKRQGFTDDQILERLSGEQEISDMEIRLTVDSR